MERINSAKDFKTVSDNKNIRRIIEPSVCCNASLKITISDDLRIRKGRTEAIIGDFFETMNESLRKSDSSIRVLDYSESENTITFGFKNSMRPDTLENLLDNGFFDSFAYRTKTYSIQVTGFEPTVFENRTRPTIRPNTLVA